MSANKAESLPNGTHCKEPVSKLKSVTFPDNSLVTIFNRSVSGSISSMESAVAGGSTVRPEKRRFVSGTPYNYPEPLNLDRSGAFVNQSPNTSFNDVNSTEGSRNENHISNGVSYRNHLSGKSTGTPLFVALGMPGMGSPGTFFENLRRETTNSSQRRSSLSEDEWKKCGETYLDQEQEVVKRRMAEKGDAPHLRPPSELISSSTERRYSAVVQQFMIKNGLLTPQPEGSVLVLQADQALPSDPTYVSWATVDQDHSPALTTQGNSDETFVLEPHGTELLSTFTGKSLNQSTESSTSRTEPPGSVESFKLKSSFPVDQVTAAPLGLGAHAEMKESASLQNLAGSTERDPNPGHSGSPSNTSLSEIREYQNDDISEGSPSRISIQVDSPNQYEYRESQRSSGGTRSFRITPLVNRWRVLTINGDSTDGATRLNTRKQTLYLGIAMTVTGVLMAVISLIVLLVILYG